MRWIEIAWANKYGGWGAIISTRCVIISMGVAWRINQTRSDLRRAKSGLYIQYRHEAELKAGTTERYF